VPAFAGHTSSLVLFFDLEKIYSTVKEHPEILAQVKASNMVELSGIEPLTPCLQSRCSPS
jgi:hypothetical protein